MAEKKRALAILRNGKKGEMYPFLDDETARLYRRATEFDIRENTTLKLGRLFQNGDENVYYRELIAPCGNSFLVDREGGVFDSYAREDYGEQILPSNSQDSEVK